MTESIAYLSGEFIPLSKATVSVMDRGFLFGDGVYEVIPVYGGKLLREDKHLKRLRNSLERIALVNPMINDEWKKVFREILNKNPGDDRSIYLQITRGAASYRDLSCAENVKATVFMMVIPITSISMEELEKGMSVITVNDFRWHACDIKSVSLIANVMLRQQANLASVTDAILIRDGNVTEGTASNFFIVKDGVIATPPKSNFLLPGITRDLVIDLANTHNLTCEIREISEDELVSADEIWLTSSTKEVAPVVTLNGKDVNDGKAGDSWRKMIKIYQEYKQELRQGKH